MGDTDTASFAEKVTETVLTSALPRLSPASESSAAVKEEEKEEVFA